MTENWLCFKHELEIIAKKHNKHIKLYSKDNWFCTFLSWLLFLLSFGFYKKEKFLHNTATALGHLHFYPIHWTRWQTEWVLLHEIRHTIHYHWMGLCIHPILGIPLAAFLYIFVLFPIKLAFGRLFIELDCDKFRYKQILDQVNDWEYLQSLKFSFYELVELQIKSISSISYFYAVPEKIARYFYYKMIKRLINETEKKLE